MEEKILAKLESLENKIDKMDVKFDALKEEIYDKLDEETVKLNKKFDELKEEIYHKLNEETVKLNVKFDEKFEKLKEEIDKKILDHMFVFEEDYGKRLTIAFEELTCRNATNKTNSEQIANLEKRCELNTAYVYSHETQIQELEKIYS